VQAVPPVPRGCGRRGRQQDGVPFVGGVHVFGQRLGVQPVRARALRSAAAVQATAVPQESAQASRRDGRRWKTDGGGGGGGGAAALARVARPTLPGGGVPVAVPTAQTGPHDVRSPGEEASRPAPSPPQPPSPEAAPDGGRDPRLLRAQRRSSATSTRSMPRRHRQRRLRRRTGQTLRVDIERNRSSGTVARVYGRRGHRRRRAGADTAAVPPQTSLPPRPEPDARPEHGPSETEKVGPTEY